MSRLGSEFINNTTNYPYPYIGFQLKKKWFIHLQANLNLLYEHSPGGSLWSDAWNTLTGIPLKGASFSTPSHFQTSEFHTLCKPSHPTKWLPSSTEFITINSPKQFGAMHAQLQMLQHSVFRSHVPFYSYLEWVSHWLPTQREGFTIFQQNTTSFNMEVLTLISTSFNCTLFVTAQGGHNFISGKNAM